MWFLVRRRALANLAGFETTAGKLEREVLGSEILARFALHPSIRTWGTGLAFRTALLVAVAALVASPAVSASIVVTTTSGATNGDVSSPEALFAQPGPDGVSLPEAVAAANQAAEPQTIVFAQDLAGGTIVLNSPLQITRDGTAITGFPGVDGKPAVTIDGRQAVQGNAALFVRASDVTVRGLRFIWRADAVSVLAGAGGLYDEAIAGWEGAPPRQAIRNILIEGNVFGLEGGSPAAHTGVRVYMEPGGQAVGASIENVRVRGNTFLRSGAPIGVVVGANGTNGEIRGVVIENNSFTDLTRGGISVECAQGSGNAVRGTRILRNRFVSETYQSGVIVFHLVDPLPPIGTFASHNLIDGTRIEGNFLLNSALGFFGGQNGATNNTISNTEVTNNVVVNGPISIFGGKLEATGNRIETLRFVNNTVLGRMIRTAPDTEGGSGNSVSGLSFVNTVIAPETLLIGITPSTFSYCLTGNSDIVAGGIHNVLGDPLLVDPAAGKFHLRPGSPAIDAGTSNGAPPVDFECRPRVGVVDIGAFEFGAPDVALLGLSVAEGVGVTDTVPAGFQCGSSVSFPRDAIVSIVATPAPGWRFIGWRGDDDCIDGTVTMSSDRRCVAAFGRGRRRAVRSGW